jgi:hypothetical protein
VLDSEAPHNAGMEQWRLGWLITNKSPVSGTGPATNFMSDEDKLILAEAALDGTLCEHHLYCSADHRKPIGVPGCICVRLRRQGKVWWWQPKRKEGIFS